MVDGFRYGFFGVSDVDPRVSLAIVCLSAIVAAAIGLRMLQSGYKLRW
jgi:ABC-2 type transport system permease protein